jgi:hypothetical protein
VEGSVVVSVSLDDTVPADGLVNSHREGFDERAPRRNDEWETGALLTAPRTLAKCEPSRRLERLENLPTSVAESVNSSIT